MRTALFSILSFFVCLFLFSSEICAQVPALNPSQTVNPADGSMGFALPLGMVKGVNGHDFPVNLYYSAGIQYAQQASPVGLGFSFGAGSITRKPVFVPDDNVSGDYEELGGASHCDDNTNRGLVTFILQGVGLIFSAILTAVGFPEIGIAIMSTMFDLGTSTIVSQTFAFKPQHFIAGGTHTPKYNYQNGGGIGYFNGGNQYDLPDLYFVSTPFISGEIIPMGPASNKFMFKSTAGSSTPDKSTLDVAYDKANQTFTIILPDGTKLIFGTESATQLDRYNNAYAWEKNADGYDCVSYQYITQKRKYVTQWYLTRVLYPDYADGNYPGDNNPLNSLSSNRGAFICFKYKTQETVGVTPIPDEVQLRQESDPSQGSAVKQTQSGELSTTGYLQDIMLDSGAFLS